MGLRDLIGADWKPTANVEGFDVIEGTFPFTITALRVEKNKQTQEYDHYMMELTLSTGRKLWKRYDKNKADKIKDMLCDLFTCAVDLPIPDNESEFEGGFQFAIGARGTVRAWKWLPEKDIKGNVIPEDQRVPKQQFKIIRKNAATIAKSDIPF